MRTARSTSFAAATSWRFSHYAGLFFDEFRPDSAWLRETAVLQLPPCEGLAGLTLRGEIHPHPDVRGLESSAPGLDCLLDGRIVARLRDLRPGPFEVSIPLSAQCANRGPRIGLRLCGVGLTNLLAWLGRMTRLAPLQRFRSQNKNRQLRILSLATADGETVFDFSIRSAPYSAAFARRHARLGLNIAGFLAADLGVGESARCMVRAADAASLPTALVPLKLHCRNRLGDQTYAARLQDTNPHRINVVHLDPPASRDLDHHHGKPFRAGKYNIAYWAWELPEFPDAWLENFAYFDEVWCPSDFVRAAISLKSPVPVLTMPHAISFARPQGDFRPRFGLPAGKFLFLALYDLNSYSERKNPAAAIAAFRQSGLAGQGAALVVKVQNVAGNEADFTALRDSVRDLPNTVLLTDTLTRDEVYQLESACDCFVSLHRSEGFGLAIAECMFLGKPVISTDWSGTAEFVNAHTGCPVRCTLTTIAQSRGPYAKGQTWAEPDAAHAAEWMRRLFADRALAAAIGAAGRAAIEEMFSPAVIGTRYRRRLDAIACF